MTVGRALELYSRSLYQPTADDVTRSVTLFCLNLTCNLKKKGKDNLFYLASFGVFELSTGIIDREVKKKKKCLKCIFTENDGK